MRVIGVGNPLFGDDGVGIRVVERLRDRVPADVELIDGSTEGLGLLSWFEGAGRIVLVDAVRMGETPGTVRLLDPARLRAARPDRDRFSAHWTNVLEVIDAAAKLGLRPRIEIVAVEPQRVEPNAELSTAAAGAVEVAAAMVMELVKEEADGTSAGE